MSIDNLKKRRFEWALWEYIESYLRPHLDIIQGREAYAFSPDLHSKLVSKHAMDNHTNSMFEDGIIFLKEDDYGRYYYLDCDSGLLFYQQEDSYYIAAEYFSAQHDIFDAACFRRVISDESFRFPKHLLHFDLNNDDKEPIVNVSDALDLSLGDILSTPILEYTARSTKELKEIVAEIESVLPFTRLQKLWFRGQRQEYLRSRSSTTIEKLGLKKEYEKMPSLIPSVGRYITRGNLKSCIDDMLLWIEAFKIWTLTQSNEFEGIFNIGSPIYSNMVKHLKPVDFSNYVYTLPYDIDEYIYIQNEQELMAEVLAMQQYGGLTSMLDITDDLDVALFFSQSSLNVDSMKYELCNPNPDNLIYVFAQARNTTTFDFSKRMFAVATSDGIKTLPLRIANQRCGLLIGANHLAHNTYAYRIVAKIRLKSDSILTTKTVNEMFPGAELDTLFRVYSDVEPKLRGLYG